MKLGELRTLVPNYNLVQIYSHHIKTFLTNEEAQAYRYSVGKVLYDGSMGSCPNDWDDWKVVVMCTETPGINPSYGMRLLSFRIVPPNCEARSVENEA